MVVMTLSEDAQQLWQTAKTLALKSRAVSPQARTLPPLLYFTDPLRTPDPRPTVRGLPEGAGVVYRHFGAANAADMARDLRQISRDNGLILLIGLDYLLAQDIGADGVHLPERALDLAPDLRLSHPNWLITGAVHTHKALEQAAALDACVLSPVFKAGGASSAKADLGLEAFSALCTRAPCPAYGLGGITAMRAPLMLDTGACGIAGVEAFDAAFGR